MNIPSTAKTIGLEDFSKFDIFKEMPDFTDSVKGEGDDREIICYLDADIPIFQVAAISDGTHYIFDGEKFKYKKDAVKECMRVGGDIKMIERCYSPMPAATAVEILKRNLDKLDSAFPGSYTINCVSSDSNYRYDIYPEYKSARKDKRKPKNRQALKEFVVNQRLGVVTPGCEADDTLGILMEATRKVNNQIPVCITIDKDLMMIPGFHFNPNKMRVDYVDETTGFLSFCQQALKGDPTDSIPGLPRVGDKTAINLLKDCDSMESMWARVESTYNLKLKGKLPDGFKSVSDYLFMNASMVWILRENGKGFIDYLNDHGIDNMWRKKD